LRDYQVHGPRAARVILDGKIHLVPLIERTWTSSADAGVVDEYILAPVTDDEAVALTVTEPLDCALDPLLMLFHSCLYTPFYEGLKVRLCPKKPQHLHNAAPSRKRKQPQMSPSFLRQARPMCTFYCRIAQVLIPVK
jgi:hypothetical protein